MTQATHVLLTVQGGYTDESLEHWQVGIRWLLQPNLVTVTIPDTGTLDPWDVTDTSTERIETDCVIETKWIRDSVAVGAFNPDDWLFDQVRPAFQDFFGPQYSSHVRVLGLKASPIDSLGHVVRDRTCQLTFTSTFPQGAATGTPLPIQTSTAISWGTPRLGPKGRGRVYPPVTTVASLDGGGELAGASQTALRDEWVSILDNSSFEAAFTPSWSITPIVTGRPYGQFGTVRQVKVGNIIDTQRRRRRQLVETYVSGPTSF